MLSRNLKNLCAWFRRARETDAGFAGDSALRFEDILRQCGEDAAELEQAQVPMSRREVPTPKLAPNVVPFPMARRLRQGFAGDGDEAC